MTTTGTPARRVATAAGASGLAAVVAGVVLIGLLHVLPETAVIDPVRRTISQYALTGSRWIFDLGVLLVAIGSAALFAGLIRAGRVPKFSAASVFAGVWTVSLLLIVAFPKTNWAIGPSVGGSIHRVASIAAFVSLPLAVVFAARTVFRDSPALRRLTIFLGITSLGWFGLIVTGVVVQLGGGGPWWQFIPLGLVERLLAANEMLAVLALGLGLFREQAPMTQVTPEGNSEARPDLVTS